MLRVPSHVRGGRWLLVDASARSALIEHLLRNQPYRVYSQRRDRSIIWDVAGQRPYTHVRPDVVVETRAPERRRLAIDAKYKVYDERRLSAGDVYQAFLYAYAYGDHDDRLPASLLLYPATPPASEQTHLAVRSRPERGVPTFGLWACTSRAR